MSQLSLKCGSVQNFGMERKIIFVLLLALGWTQCVQSQLPENLSCSTAVDRQPFNLTDMSGYWYEIVRAPNLEVMKCLNVSVPSTVDKELQLELQYIQTVDKKKPLVVKETLSFPWNEDTSKGIFKLQYDTPLMNLTLTYKIQFSYPKQFVILCGYAASATLPIIKVLSRQREIPANQMLLKKIWVF